ncbi:cation-translocating P-type ATPase [Candidatus Woesearchaeota archaeon]|nr:cation-translocating P-type ATPase [Candidatus Woesearchaeota archaeon]
MIEEKSNYYTKSVSAVQRSFETNENGLSPLAVQDRLKKYGCNIIKEQKKIHPFLIFLRQFQSVVVHILLGAVIISFFLGNYIDASVIISILIFNAVFGFVQEYKAEKSIEALRKLASLKAKVIRAGEVQEIDAKELVPGDLLLLEEGDKIPADARLVECIRLKAQEAALTGESQAVEKHIRELSGTLALGDQKNMVFSGTIITSGRGKAIITGTGMQTEIGKIATLLEETEEQQTPLQKKLDNTGKMMGYGTILICIIVFALAIYEGDPLLPSFLAAVALAVAAIPEGLPAVITIALALGVERMIKKNVLIRKLPSVETLGSTTVICTDKTGTLTKNEMTVRQMYMNKRIVEVTGSGYNTTGLFYHQGVQIDPKEFHHLLKIGALSNNAHLDGEKIIGDPTEGSLIVSAHKAQLFSHELEKTHPRVDEIVFDSQRKRMSTVHLVDKKPVIYTKGAPDIVLHLCSRIFINGKVRKITPADKKEIFDVNHRFSSGALRVLAFAYKEIHPKVHAAKQKNNAHYTEEDEQDLIFVGLQAMIDPPRDEVRASIEKCHSAGIRVIMITGDYEATARAIAQELSIGSRVMNGQELAVHMHLDDVIESIDIFARVNPEHKLKIVEALQKKGHVVAMTGDGVNDAPALKQADIGIAMGITGTDVAKEASDMILTDDHFSSIVNAVEEGRGIYGNIKKYFAFLLSGNISEVLIVFVITLLGFPLPLVATQLLLINLVTDGFPALAMSVDPFEPNSMAQKPRKKTEPLYKGLAPYLVFYPFMMTLAAVSVFSYMYTQEGNLLLAQTMTFLLICIFELFQALSCRSTIGSSLKAGLFKNHWLLLAIASSAAVAGAVIFVPFLQPLFGTTILTGLEIAAIVIISTSGFVVIEIAKGIQNIFHN